MKKINLTLFLVFVLFAFNAFSQSKKIKINDSTKTFYDIKKEFEEYWKDKTPTPGSGYNIFKRWAHYMEPRVYPSGNIHNDNYH